MECALHASLLFLNHTSLCQLQKKVNHGSVSSFGCRFCPLNKTKKKKQDFNRQKQIDLLEWLISCKINDLSVEVHYDVNLSQ